MNNNAFNSLIPFVSLYSIPENHCFKQRQIIGIIIFLIKERPPGIRCFLNGRATFGTFWGHPTAPKITWFEYLQLFYCVNTFNQIYTRTLDKLKEAIRDEKWLRSMVILMTYEMADFPQELEIYIKKDRHHLPGMILTQDTYNF